jgi:hypothetical protein
MAATRRKRLSSVLFGLGSAVVIGLVGPLYGGLVLVLAFPLVFRAAIRVAPAWLLAAFGISWLLLLATGTAPFVRNSLTDGGGLWTTIGVVPLALAGGILGAARFRQVGPPPTGRPS